MKNFIIKIKENFLPFFLIFFGILSAMMIFQGTVNYKYSYDNHLLMLAERFTQLKISLSGNNLPPGDYVDYFAQIYLYFGPFSSIILIPVVLIFGMTVPQIIIGISCLIIAFLVVYKISGRFSFSEKDSLWLSIFYVFSTVQFCLGITNITAYQVQILGSTLLLLSLSEYFGKKRYLLIGILLALAGLTRFTLYLSVLFFFIELLSGRINKKQFIILLIPVILSGILYGAYNSRRFHSIFETGYKYNITLKNYPISSNIKWGFFSPKHIPANLYILLFKAPDPILESGGGFVLKFPYLKVDPWGLSILFTSPLLVYLILNYKKTKYSLSLIITILAIAVPSLVYSGIGFAQFGYRYSMDFLPFLFILLLPSLVPVLSWKAKILITIGVLFNCLFVGSLWGIYPHFLIY